MAVTGPILRNFLDLGQSSGFHFVIIALRYRQRLLSRTLFLAQGPLHLAGHSSEIRTDKNHNPRAEERMFMSFNYDKHKHQDDHGNQWTSYSDLFLGLSVIFLLLYVVASLRSGTAGIQSQIENKRMTMEVQDLKNQLKVYNSLKKDYLEQGATKEEEEQYGQLMNKLSLLQEEAKTEKERLQQQALENGQKEKALNQYQQMVRNIINANMIAKTRIKKRDDTIEEQETEISEQSTEIADLEKNLNAKKRQIQEGEAKITEANQALEKRMKQLREAYKSQEISKKKFDTQKQQLEEENNKRVAELENANKQASAKLNEINSKLSTVSGELASTKGALTQKEMEAAAIKSRFAEESARKEKEFGSKLASVNQKLKGTEGELQKAREQIEAKKKLAKDIKNALQKVGVNADVDGQSGDVTIDFGEYFFETGKATINDGMRRILEKAIPAYSATLFEDPMVADKITNVEIIGYASPTYQGKFIDPATLDSKDRKAVQYNLELSQKRANAIFEHIFDKKKMTFNHQKELLPLVKVTGRSFLPEKKRAAGTGRSNDFCETHDCKKAQRVIIKFTMDN